MRRRLLSFSLASFVFGLGCGGDGSTEQLVDASIDDATADVDLDGSLDGSLGDSADVGVGDGDDAEASDALDEADAASDGDAADEADAIDGDDAADADGGTDAADDANVGDGGDGAVGWNPACLVCHGDVNPAPPKALSGALSNATPAVGAHQEHLAKSSWHHELQCTECHLVPTIPSFDPAVPTHRNHVTDLIWGPIARTGTYDKALYTCTGSYCHGASLRADATGSTSNREPLWTLVDGTQKDCGTSCHTTPPGGGHPPSTACETCHAEVISSFTPGAPPTATWKDASLHIDGTVQVSGALTCTSCHGDPLTNKPVPPRDTHGGTATTDPGVGAHAHHLAPKTWARDVLCSDCHTLPTSFTHANGVIDFTWGAVSTASGAKPAFDTTTITCGSVYCHGSTLLGPVAGGSVARTPTWTKVDGTFNACGSSCHTNPPGGTHPNNTDCTKCHGSVIASYDPATKAATWKDRTLHVNGTVEVVSLTCTSCHGDATTNSPAPPKGTKGETLATQKAVGAHEKHLGTRAWSRDVVCADCHTLPTSTSHANGKHDFAWGAVATSSGATPGYDDVSATCSSVYCHGSTLLGPVAGGTVARVPVWNVNDGSFEACGTSCHTNPPGETHPNSTDCAKCHDAVIATYDPASKTATWKDRTLHVNGTVEVASLSCTSCHGDAATGVAAPPKGTKGETATTQKAVGAHLQHVGTHTWSRDVQCTDCHTVPTSTSHANGKTDFAWGAVSTASGALPAYDATTSTCASVYCHGATLLGPVSGGVVNRAPSWTTVDGTQDACGTTCHTNPPGGSHPNRTDCAKCHGAVIASYDPLTRAATWTNRNLHVDGKVDAVALTCTTCHGDPTTKSPAPPFGNKGETTTSQKAVGAHQAHLAASAYARDVQCSDCHALPTSTSHSNGVTDFTWGAVAKASGAVPTYDAATSTCSNNYCHGSTLLGPVAGGAVNHTPSWTTVNGSQDACGSSCHTNPPGGTHPNDSACQKCHGAVIATYDAAGRTATWKDKTLHVDGKVDVVTMGCTTCHGDGATNNPAPPLGVKGETATNQKPVGAHAAHLLGSTWSRDVVCTDCHTVPTTTSHSNGVTDFTWGAVAKASGAVPTYDAASSSCSNNYCHGSTLLGPIAGGVVNHTPSWTTVNGSQDACGTTCHTNPPGGTHPNDAACQKCHGAVIASYDAATKTATWSNHTLHVNGSVEVVPLGCTTCHGNGATNNPAPPLGVKGETATTQKAVGAHAAHLTTSTSARDVLCTDCHAVPTSTSHSNGATDLAWGAVATTGGAVPTYSATTATCSNNYCHGSTLAGPVAGGVVNHTPSWTTVNGTQDACGSTCHTNPPGGTHPNKADCATCHGSVIASYDPTTKTATWKDRTLHVDGVVETTTMTCTACHGTAATNDPAPPLGVKGETATTQKPVGAHQQHLGTRAASRDIQCTDCHAVPTNTKHSNGVTDFAWGAVAKASGAVPTYDGTTATCTNNYCHGSTLLGPIAGGAVNHSPSWTTVNGTQDACGSSCHTNPPGGSHPPSADCVKCHGAVIATYDAATKTATWTDRTLHVNGTVEVVAMTCTTCHGNAATNTPAPPTGVKGETATTQKAVGAHAAHLATSSYARDVLCADCHAVPTSTSHSNSATDFAWGAVATTGGAAPAYDATTATCSNNYCHGSTLLGPNAGGVVNRTPSWTTVNGTQDACGATCHTNPPGGAHPANPNCQTCHGAVIATYDAATKAATWTNRTLHVNGSVELTPLTCSSCHGNAATNNPAPPIGTKGETATTQKPVGAHAAHLAVSTWSRDVTCTDCHAVPASMSHTNSVTDFAWGSVSTASGATPGYSAATSTCANVYCHGSTLQGAVAGGVLNRAPSWTTVNGTQAACGTTCHTNPPGGTHPGRTDCANCHPSVISSYDPATKTATWSNRSAHVNGAIDVTVTCTSCHGTTATNNPAPPLGTKGETATTQKAVGAHAVHLATSSWARTVTCTDCHAVPASNGHSNGATDFSWSAVSTAAGAAPTYDGATASCANVYCHGATLKGPIAGGTVSRTPVWTTVNGSFDACGTTCHTNPPGGTHPTNPNCGTCHGAVITSYDPATKAATWLNPSLHVDGTVQVSPLTCQSCHGSVPRNDAAPPIGTRGETATTQKPVGAHQAHLTPTTWSRDVVCADCHAVPASMSHATGTTDYTWGAVSRAEAASPTYTSATATCSSVYCHGSTLGPAKAGGTVSRSPVWTTVNGSFDTCGNTCHTNPPGGTHVAHTDCKICHAAVIATFDPATNTATWANRTRHVDGIRDTNKYHDLAGWTSPINGASHHGSNYFLKNQQRDEHNTACTVCHGANLDGGTVGVSCNNASCHRSTDWRSCTFCHGTLPSQSNPPVGVGGETLTSTLAVGRHTAHLTASTTHVAFACATCHAVPAAGDIAHAAQYLPSANLATPGHHGDLAFTLGATGMTWNVAATQGTTPFTARGTCVGACHSNGRGGAPVVTPYWAGGAWTAGSCGNCHAASPNSGEHPLHYGEGLTCNSCHPPSSGSMHMNGTRNVNATITPPSGTGSVTTIPPGGVCGTKWGCTGTCHGKKHGPFCWP